MIGPLRIGKNPIRDGRGIAGFVSALCGISLTNDQRLYPIKPLTKLTLDAVKLAAK